MRANRLYLTPTANITVEVHDERMDADMGCKSTDSSSCKNRISNDYVNEVFECDQELLIVALTGRSGSDLGGIVKLLTSKALKQTLLQPAFTDGFKESEIRDLRIIQRFMRARWHPFVEVSVNAVMLSFLLDLDPCESDKQYSFDCVFHDQTSNVVKPFEQLEKILDNGASSLRLRTLCIEKLRNLDQVLSRGFRPEYGIDQFSPFLESELDALLNNLTLPVLHEKWCIAKLCLEDRDFSKYETVALCFGVLPSLAELFEEGLNVLHDNLFALVYQRIGNEIRAYGRLFAEASSEKGARLFDLPRRINSFCRVVRHYCQAFEGDGEWGKNWNPASIVIHSLKNPFEAFYLKQHYSNFYLVSISTDNDSGGARTTLYSTLRDQMDYVAMGESPAILKDVIFKVENGLSDEKGLKATWERLATLGSTELEKEAKNLRLEGRRLRYAIEVFKNEHVRYSCYKNETEPYVLQDVVSCTESADVFITRDVNESVAAHDYGLVRSLARFVVLAMHPGLLKPTKVERCMQIAVSAKLNSGCLSRQVGAVVADEDFNILSLGWNDAPFGSEVCSRRNFLDAATKYDRHAYSNFELNDQAFREYMDCANAQYRQEDGAKDLNGLPAAYCFKDVYQDIINTRDQIHTRALHGEERALAACGNQRAKGGYLFTTSSPCELCAKKAKEAGIKRIYYIERYKGISHDHIIDEGPLDKRAEYEFFVGALGCAYVKLYTPVVPYKDELSAVGITPKLLKRRYDDKGRL